MSYFRATIICRFTYLATLVEGDADFESMVIHFNKVITDTAAELRGKQRRTKKKPCVTPEVLDICDPRRELNKERWRSQRLKRQKKYQFRDEDDKRVLDRGSVLGSGSMHQKAKKNKKPYQLVKGLTREKQGISTTIEPSRSTAETLKTMRLVLACPQIPDEEQHHVLREEVEAAVKALEKGKSVDNITTELVQAGGEAMIDILTSICNKVWKTGTDDHMDSIPSYHTSKERRLAAVLEQQNHQSYQLSCWSSS